MRPRGAGSRGDAAPGSVGRGVSWGQERTRNRSRTGSGRAVVRIVRWIGPGGLRETGERSREEEVNRGEREACEQDDGEG